MLSSYSLPFRLQEMRAVPNAMYPAERPHELLPIRPPNAPDGAARSLRQTPASVHGRGRRHRELDGTIRYLLGLLSHERPDATRVASAGTQPGATPL